MITEKFVIDKYLGIKFSHRGRTIKGLDCWGLAKMIYEDMGYPLWELNVDYDQGWARNDANYFLENYYKEWREVDVPQLFDGVLFKNSRGVADHGGLMLSNARFIHAVRGGGVVITRLSDQYWSRRFCGYYRLRARDERPEN